MAEEPNIEEMCSPKHLKLSEWEGVGYIKNDQRVVQEDESGKVNAKGFNTSVLMQHL